jgi:uncharacterized zinc-type alcohol dehydrogenase-like protein
MHHPFKTRGFAAITSKAPLVPFEFERRALRPKDVLIEIRYSGICHSDIHQVRDEWGGAQFPMVPGHEIVGIVKAKGARVRRFRVGDAVGVGCMVDSCRKCSQCREGEEQFCEQGAAFTYNSTEMDRKTPTLGGYSSVIVVDEAFVLKIGKGLALHRVAPLLCAGITTYSPLKRFGARKGKTIGVIGLGGLGHMAVKIAKAMGAQVTVLSSSAKKKSDAIKLGAKAFVLSSEPAALEKLSGAFDLIIDTVSAPHDLNSYLSLLKRDGTLVLVGVPPEAASIHAFSLIGGRRRLAGSLIGGIRETQEMLNFCAKKKVLADVEVIEAHPINEAYQRMLEGDVRYRFVIDAKTF